MGFEPALAMLSADDGWCVRGRLRRLRRRIRSRNGTRFSLAASRALCWLVPPWLCALVSLVTTAMWVPKPARLAGSATRWARSHFGPTHSLHNPTCAGPARFFASLAHAVTGPFRSRSAWAHPHRDLPHLRRDWRAATCVSAALWVVCNRRRAYHGAIIRGQRGLSHPLNPAARFVYFSR